MQLYFGDVDDDVGLVKDGPSWTKSNSKSIEEAREANRNVLALFPAIVVRRQQKAYAALILPLDTHMLDLRVIAS